MPLSFYRHSMDVWSAAAEGDVPRIKMWLKSLAQKSRTAPKLDEVEPWSGWTALMMAAASNQIEVVKALLAVGADVMSVNDQGETAAHLAAKSGYNRVLKLLVLQNKKVLWTKTKSAEAEDRKTPLHYACESSRINGLRLMLALAPSKSVITVLGNMTYPDEDLQEVIEDAVKEHKDAEFLKNAQDMKDSWM